MRRRIIVPVILLALLLFPLGAQMIVSRCFDLAMEQERSRALSEEAAIARAVALEIGSDAAQGQRERLISVAQHVQSRYGSPSLSVMLVYYGEAMGGRTLPSGLEQLLATKGRATLLSDQQLYIAHSIGEGVTLLLISDVAAVYALRRELSVWAGMLSAAGVILSALLAAAIADWMARPFRRLAQQRQEFIDALAHEMRTPLTAILGAGSLLQRARMPQEKQMELLSTIVDEARRLSDMDGRLLQLTRLEHEAPEFTRFSSMEMAKEALAVFEGVELGGEDAQFFAERELIVQMLRNLVVNAQRAGGEAPVRVTMEEDGFSVEDSGCGMTREQIAQAFDPFYKADKARTRKAGGAGLGLTLCMKIARLHGGRIEIDSEPGKGTRVVYRMVTGA